MKQNLSKYIVSFLIGLCALPTAAQGLGGYETVNLNANFTVNDSETKSVSLNGVHRLKNIVVQAEGISQDSTIEVMVNGQIKGTIYAPGRDPSYVVTVEEATRSIEFRHRTGGSMRIIAILATQSVWSKPVSGGSGAFYGDKEVVQQLAATALAQIEILKGFAAPMDVKDYLYPIKKNAGLVYVMSNAHGDLSKRTIAQLVALMDQIDFANAYLGTLMQQDDAFESVVELLTVRETISDLLD